MIQLVKKIVLVDGDVVAEASEVVNEKEDESDVEDVC